MAQRGCSKQRLVWGSCWKGALLGELVGEDRVQVGAKVSHGRKTNQPQTLQPCNALKAKKQCSMGVSRNPEALDWAQRMREGLGRDVLERRKGGRDLKREGGGGGVGWDPLLPGSPDGPRRRRAKDFEA